MEQITRHAQQRMNQRGIQSTMVELALECGEFDQRSRCIFRKKDAIRELSELRNRERTLKKIIDKGGVVVVEDRGAVITTYNYQGRNH